MAARRGRTVDPERVKTFDDWLDLYKQKYTNLRLDDGGHFSVYATDDTKKLVKRVSPKRGMDANTVLASPESPAELRALAIAKYAELKTARDTNVVEAKAGYIRNEIELLNQIGLWSKADDDAQRVALTYEIAEQSRALETADKHLQTIQYKRRNIRSNEIMRHSDIDYTTRDTRTIGMTLNYYTPEETTVEDRIIPLPAEA